MAEISLAQDKVLRLLAEGWTQDTDPSRSGSGCWLKAQGKESGQRITDRTLETLVKRLFITTDPMKAFYWLTFAGAERIQRESLFLLHEEYKAYRQRGRRSSKTMSYEDWMMERFKNHQEVQPPAPAPERAIDKFKVGDRVRIKADGLDQIIPDPLLIKLRDSRAIGIVRVPFDHKFGATVDFMVKSRKRDMYLEHEWLEPVSMNIEAGDYVRLKEDMSQTHGLEYTRDVQAVGVVVKRTVFTFESFTVGFPAAEGIVSVEELYLVDIEALHGEMEEITAQSPVLPADSSPAFGAVSELTPEDWNLLARFAGAVLIGWDVEAKPESTPVADGLVRAGYLKSLYRSDTWAQYEITDAGRDRLKDYQAMPEQPAPLTTYDPQTGIEDYAPVVDSETAANLRQALRDVEAGRTQPIETLWDGISELAAARAACDSATKLAAEYLAERDVAREQLAEKQAKIRAIDNALSDVREFDEFGVPLEDWLRTTYEENVRTLAARRDAFKQQLQLFANADACKWHIVMDDAEQHVKAARVLLKGASNGS